jgi:DHA1 family tetracycline resistance protein-like MFS transporter
VLASITSLAAVVGPLMISALYFAYRTTFPGIVWLAGAALYVLCLPVLLRSAPFENTEEPALPGLRCCPR